MVNPTPVLATSGLEVDNHNRTPPSYAASAHEKSDAGSATLHDHSAGVLDANTVVDEKKDPAVYEETRYAGEDKAHKLVDDDILKRVQTSEEGHEYPSGLKLTFITVALCLAVFCMALDNTILATAIPKITTQFDSLSDVGWYGSAYLLTTAALQLFFGKLYSFYPIKLVFLVAIAIFELGSLICGVAPNSVALIVGRAIAGVGSAGIFSGALIIIAYSTPLAKRPMYTGLIGAMYGLASVAGPLLGGVFTDKVTWRLCFLINLPLGAITVVFLIFTFKSPARKADEGLTWKRKLVEMDIPGTLVFLPAIICLLLAMQWGGSKYAWGNARIIVLFVLAGVLITTFLVMQFRRPETATLAPRILKQRSIWASCLFAFCLGAAFFIIIYFLPIWFQAVQGVDAVQSGIRNLPMILSLVVMSLVAGIGVTISGYYTPFVILSSIVATIGYGLLTTLTPDAPRAHWLGFQAAAGLGVGLGMQQTMMAVQTVLDIRDVPTGTSLLIFLQTLGGALFVAVAQSVFSNKLLQNLAVQAPEVDAESVIRAGATNLQAAVSPLSSLPAVRLAYSDALTVTFTIATAMSAISIVGALALEWVSMKKKKPSTLPA